MALPALVSAQTEEQENTDQVVLREFDAEKLEDYRNNRNYQYEPIPIAEKGGFSRFIEKIQRWLNDALGMGDKALDVLFWLIFIAVFILFIVKIFGVEGQFFSPGKKNAKTAYEIDEEQLDQINFEEEIQKAIQSSQWRLAIRLIYLFALKHLADSEQIDVRKGKTNHDYLYELSAGEQRENFSNLSFLFDYTWYGHFSANASLTEKANDYLRSIKTGKGGKP